MPSAEGAKDFFCDFGFKNTFKLKGKNQYR